jgi:hypothetical protein
MMHRSTAGSRTAKRVFLSLIASACLIVGSPVVATGSASSPGAHKAVSADHGDCKNDNAGKHNGYDCPVEQSGGGTDTPTSTDVPDSSGVINAS